jgi:hypothetical protein
MRGTYSQLGMSGDEPCGRNLRWRPYSFLLKSGGRQTAISGLRCFCATVAETRAFEMRDETRIFGDGTGALADQRSPPAIDRNIGPIPDRQKCHRRQTHLHLTRNVFGNLGVEVAGELGHNESQLHTGKSGPVHPRAIQILHGRKFFKPEDRKEARCCMPFSERSSLKPAESSGSGESADQAHGFCSASV